MIDWVSRGLYLNWTIGLLSALICATAFGQTSDVNLAFEGDSVTVGDTFILQIQVSDLSNSSVISYQFALSYPPDKLAYRTFQKDGTLSSSSEILIDNPDQENGLVRIGGIFVNPIDGAGELLRLQFDAVGAGEATVRATDLIVNTTSLADPDPGSVRISSQSSPTHPYTPNTLQPADGSTTENLTPTFTWSEFQGVDAQETQAGYQLRVRSDSDGDAIVYDTGPVSSGSVTSHTYSPGSYQDPDPAFTDIFNYQFGGTTTHHNLWQKVSEDRSYCEIIEEHVYTANGRLYLEVPASPATEGAEIASIGNDYHYGTYRFRMKTAGTGGVGNAFTLFRSQEEQTSLEFLSNEPNRLYLRNTRSGQTDQMSQNVTFSPGQGYHVYTIEWTSEALVFSADGQELGRFTENIPTEQAQIRLTNWTGNSDRGGGPPETSTAMGIEWIRYIPEGSPGKVSLPLEKGKKYHWHVRMKSSNGYWSDWSANTTASHQEFFTPTLPSLLVSPDNFSVGYESGSVAAEISHTGETDIGWTAEVVDGKNWLSISSGSSGTNTDDVVLQYNANSGELSRAGRVRITAENVQNSPQWVTVTQSPPQAQEIGLNKGWNIVSFNIHPSTTDLLEIFQPLIDRGELLKVQGEQGAAIEYLDTPIHSWINGIGSWDAEEGYYVKVQDSTGIQVKGDPVQLPVSVSLQPGGNIHGYPVQRSVDAMTFYNPLIDSGVLKKVQDEQGAALEYIGDPINQWINGIGDLQPGEGYYITVTDSTVLEIGHPGSSIDRDGGFMAKSQAPVNLQSDLAPKHFIPVGDGNSPFGPMNIYIMDFSFSDFLEEGDEIGIFDSTNCIGSHVYTNGRKMLSIVIGQDDPSTEYKDGFTVGEKPKVVIWDQSTGNEYTLSRKHVTVARGEYQFRAHSSLVLKLNEFPEMADGQKREAFQLINNYPDPFNATTTIPFVLPEESNVVLSIYNIRGELVRTLIDGPMAKGPHSVVWDGRNSRNIPVSSGVYFYRIRTPEATKIKKCTMIQ